jgi:hypothetical protein
LPFFIFLVSFFLFNRFPAEVAVAVEVRANVSQF